MLAEADAAIARGENVAIVVAPHFTHRAHELACIAGLRNIAGARFICAGLDMSLEHARGFPGTLFVDHLAAGEP